eukprot:SAG31_NODE_368_length_16798_cov_20.422780_9_plen_90_part_00
MVGSAARGEPAANCSGSFAETAEKGGSSEVGGNRSLANLLHLHTCKLIYYICVHVTEDTSMDRSTSIVSVSSILDQEFELNLTGTSLRS